jgi:hypothetical protein
MTRTTGRATGGSTVKGWDEQPYAEHEGAPKLTHAGQGEAEMASELRWTLE